MQRTLNLEEYAKIARQAAAEGCVLLKNDNEALPLKKGDRVAVFGRCAMHYYKSGLGSGGLVNTRYVVSILDALQANKDITVDETLLQIYQDWSLENPVDEGHGWGTIPWSQQEMPVTDAVIEAAKAADVALVIIGRTAGEDQDNAAEAGSYLLTDTEKEMLAQVCGSFQRTVVLLNVGNIIDMKWVEEYQPDAVMYVWQGGQEGGNGVADVLTGAISPCGKLTDTIAYDITDYPSTENFGDQFNNYYTEDIYVGYRYFETFARQKVQYPFGYGLSYTQFEIQAELCEVTDTQIAVRAAVKNIGAASGKEVVQVYVSAPQGRMGKAARELIGFAKTKVLVPEETQELTIVCPKAYFAAYDDAGVTGNRFCYVLEEGEYQLYVGNDVRSAAHSGSWTQELQVLEQLQEACAPIEEFERYKAKQNDDGTYSLQMEKVPLRITDMKARLESLRAADMPYTGDKGYRLQDVVDGKVTLDEFVAQLTDEDLICLFRGEGMCSPKVTPGTAGAFGGVTDELRAFGIPVICCADGPSGIRMDCGSKAFSLPNGTALGSSFNPELVEQLFIMMGKELRKNKVDTLLGPGINIHRSPLNGRNFEYISEDPLLTGKMGACQLRGMHRSDVTGTIKHYAANNQEHYRTTVGASMSERALREIYLKGYEIAVKEGDAKSIMTTYGPINGTWTAGNFDLCTVILRNEWKFKGIVMTDWWATSNWDREPADKTNRAPMVRAQNDLFMCCADSKADMAADNVREALENGEITRSDLQRNAKNLLNFIMGTPAMLRELGRDTEEYGTDADDEEDDFNNIPYFAVDKAALRLEITDADMDLEAKELLFGLAIPENGDYRVTFEVKSELTELAQLPLSVYVDNIYMKTISFRGTEGKKVEHQETIGAKGQDHYVKLVRQGNGLELVRIVIEKQ